MASKNEHLDRRHVALAELEAISLVLRRAADEAHDEIATSQDQLAAENAVAAGIAVLAGEPEPDPAAEVSGRPTRAADLAVTTDLIVRAIKASFDESER